MKILTIGKIGVIALVFLLVIITVPTHVYFKYIMIALQLGFLYLGYWKLLNN